MEAAYSNVAGELVGALFTSDPAVLDTATILAVISPLKMRVAWLPARGPRPIGRAVRSRSPSPSSGRAGASRDDTGGGSRSPRASPQPGDGANDFFKPGDGPNLEVFWKNATDFAAVSASMRYFSAVCLTLPCLSAASRMLRL
jgi:hypothetical protein